MHDITQEMVEGTERLDTSSDQPLSYAETRLIRSSVDLLPLEQRQAIEMAFLGGMTQNQIADSLRQPPAAIRARIRRGLVKLRQEVKEML